MKEQTITRERVSQFENHVRMEEKAQNTIEKYIRDITAFAEYLCGKAISNLLLLINNICRIAVMLCVA